MRIASVGHAVFASALIALGVYGLLKGDFTPVWEPVPEGLPARKAVVYLCAFIFLSSGIGLLWQRTRALAARVLLASLLLWFVLFRLPNLVRAPASQDPWSGSAETAVVIAATWALYAGFAAAWDQRRFRFAVGDKGVRIARAIYGLALIPFGTAHFAYLKETASLVPPWLPAHQAWAYFTGCAFLAAGVAVLIGVCARLAAVLSTLQLGLFTLLVWIPILVAGSKDDYQWSETILSAALTTAAWVVTDSYRGVPWLSTRRGFSPSSLDSQRRADANFSASLRDCL